MTWNPTIAHDDGSLSEGDETVQEAPGPQSYTVAVYLTDRAYGGPEEGGWYYDCGTLAREFWHLTKVFKTEAEACAYARSLNNPEPFSGDELTEANKDRPSTSSMLSIGRYAAEVWPDFPPHHYPETRPHYE